MGGDNAISEELLSAACDSAAAAAPVPAAVHHLLSIPVQRPGGDAAAVADDRHRALFHLSAALSDLLPPVPSSQVCRGYRVGRVAQHDRAQYARHRGTGGAAVAA